MAEEQGVPGWLPAAIGFLQLEERLVQSNKNICGTFMWSRRNGLRDHTGRGINSLSCVESISGAVAREIVFHGTKAVGVRISQLSSSSQKQTSPQQITANRIVLCAGTLGSPELLLRSGIGPCDQLRDLRIAQQSSLAEIIHEPLTPEPRDVAEVGKLLRTYAQSIYHPIGTCAMRSPLADYSPVLNEQLQVLGTENLWIADASVLPDQPSCNPNRTVILIADRLAQTFGASV